MCELEKKQAFFPLWFAEVFYLCLWGFEGAQCVHKEDALPPAGHCRQQTKEGISFIHLHWLDSDERKTLAMTQRAQGTTECSSTHDRDDLQGRIQPSSWKQRWTRLSLSPSTPPAVLLVEGVRTGQAPNATSKATAGISKDWTLLLPCMQWALHALPANQHRSLDAKSSPSGDGTVWGWAPSSSGAGMEGQFQAAAAALQTVQRPVRLSQADSTADAAEGMAGGKEDIWRIRRKILSGASRAGKAPGSSDSAWGRQICGGEPCLPAAWDQLW